jgi:hypothetical protein
MKLVRDTIGLLHVPWIAAASSSWMEFSMASDYPRLPEFQRYKKSKSPQSFMYAKVLELASVSIHGNMCVAAKSYSSV